MINICILQHHRDLIRNILFYLNKIKPENKNKICISILTQNWGKQYVDIYRNAVEEIINGIDVKIVEFKKGGNYWEKTKWMSEQDFDYVLKHDEDVFMNNHVYDYLIENAGILDDPNNLFLAPVLSTGIPTVEYFAENQLTEKEREKLYNIFLQEKMIQRWGTPGDHLNEFTIHAKEWNPDGFYKAVDKIFHFYKGIHPVRFSYEAQKYINELILEKFEAFESNRDYKTITIKRPYFCNSCFLMKQNIYKEIVESDRWRRDIYDEVSLNLCMTERNLNMVFIENSFGIHIKYGCVGNKDINRVESTFGKTFSKKVFGC